MNNELIRKIKHNEEEFHLFYIQDRWWYLGSQIADYLEYENGVKSANKIINNGHKLNVKKNGNEKLFNYVGEINGLSPKTSNISFIDENGFVILIERTDKITSENKKKIIMSILNTNEGFLINTERKEIKFINQLEEQLSVFNIEGVRQYYIDGYRLDYYIPDLNIAIEYDENDHKGYTYEQHKGRQAEIEKKLKCRFIRVSDRYNSNIACAKILKAII